MTTRKLLSFFERDKDKYGFVDIHGNVVIEPKYENASSSSKGVAWASLGSHFYLIHCDSLKRYPLPPNCETSDSFKYGRLAVHDMDVGLSGYVDCFGEFEIRPRYHGAGDFDHLGATVGPIGEEQRIDREGNLTGGVYRQVANCFPEGSHTWAIREMDGSTLADWFSRAWVVNGRGEIVSSRGFYSLRAEVNGRLPACFTKEEVGWVKPSGEILMRLPGRSIGRFVGGHIAMQDLNEKWGTVNLEGKWVIEPEFEYVQLVEDNRVATYFENPKDKELDPLCELRDFCGHLITNSQFTEITTFDEGVAQVARQVDEAKSPEANEFNYIDLNGRLLLNKWYRILE